MADIVSLLAESEFTPTHVRGVPAYENSAAGRARYSLAFKTEYESPAAAQEAKLLLKIFLRAGSKGTESYPTEAALGRAFTMECIPAPGLDLERQQHQLTLLIEGTLPRNPQAPERSASILHELFFRQRFMQDHSLLDTVQKETVQDLEDSLMFHGSRGLSLFENRFFPAFTPRLSEQLIPLVAQATPEQLQSLFERHLQRSAPAFLYAGEENAGVLAPFAQMLAGTLGPSPMPKAPTPQRMARGDAYTYCSGPSAQAQHIRFHPFRSIPSPDELQALELFNGVLGGGWTGELMKVIREKHHLVYSIRSKVSRRHNGLFITTEHLPASYKRIRTLTDEIFATAIEHCTSARIDEIRQELLEERVSRHDDDLVAANHPAARIAYGKSRLVMRTAEKPLAQEYATLATLSARDVQAAAAKHLYPPRSCTFIYAKVRP